MTYGVISQWTSNVSMDAAMEALAREKYLPGIKALGALSAFFIYTGDTTFNVVTIYPDEATATAAAEKQKAMRAQAAAEMPIKVVGEVRGNVFASF
jgi:phage-related baseplate assembly protein